MLEASEGNGQQPSRLLLSDNQVENEQVQECAAQSDSIVLKRDNEDMYINALQAIPFDDNFEEVNASVSDMRPVANLDAISLRQLDFDFES